MIARLEFERSAVLIYKTPVIQPFFYLFLQLKPFVVSSEIYFHAANALIIFKNSPASKLAPPTRPPSMALNFANSPAFLEVMLAPYITLALRYLLLMNLITFAARSGEIGFAVPNPLLMVQAGS